MSALKMGYVKTILKRAIKKFMAPSFIELDSLSFLFTNEVADGWRVGGRTDKNENGKRYIGKTSEVITSKNW